MAFIVIGHQVRLYLTSHGIRGEARFAELFLDAYLRLPTNVCLALLAYWRQRPGSPTIELLHALHEQEWAAVDHRGHRLQFLAGVVDVMPDEMVRDLCAHELCHSWQWASDTRFTPGREHIECETHADKMVKAWGFSPTSWIGFDVGAARQRPGSGSPSAGAVRTARTCSFPSRSVALPSDCIGSGRVWV